MNALRYKRNRLLFGSGLLGLVIIVLGAILYFLVTGIIVGGGWFGALFGSFFILYILAFMGIAMLVVSISCLIGWAFALRREGEETTTVIGHRWNPQAIGQLTDQLDSINSSLARLSR